MTQAELAEGAGFTPAFISAIERGHTMPSLPAVQLLSARLGVRLPVLFADVERRLGDEPGS